MLTKKDYGGGIRLMMAVALFMTISFPPATLGDPGAVDAEAKALLQRATEYLAGQQKFSVDTESSLEVVLTSGQKIQFDHSARLSLERPNKLRAERLGDLVDQVFVYDGESLTLHNPGDGVYATLPAPGTIEEMLDFARESLDIIAPAGDLLYRNAFELLMKDVNSGFIVGMSVAGGVRCHHLAFRAPHVDWQIWIQEGNEPLPRKLVITSLDVENAPQFAVVMTQWNIAPEFDGQTFVFTPPADAVGIEFLPVAGSNTQAE